MTAIDHHPRGPNAQLRRMAVDTHRHQDLPTYRRDRAASRVLLRAGLAVIRRLHRDASGLQRTWQVEAPRLTSVEYWRSYIRKSTKCG